MTKLLPALFLAASVLPGAAMATTHKVATHKTAKTAKTRTYDCTKAGNADKKACKH